MLNTREGFSFLRTEEKGVFVWGTVVPLDTLITRCKYYTEVFSENEQFFLVLYGRILHNVQTKCCFWHRKCKKHTALNGNCCDFLAKVV